MSLFFSLLIPAYAEIETMTVSELYPGMTGYARTVIQGTEIEEFEVEIIDIFTQMGFNGGPLILCRLSGDVVEQTGGIAGGYSGSPVFMDGKLIGALSAGWPYTGGMVCAATPIHEMLRAFTYPTEEPPRIASVPECLNEPIEVNGRIFESVIVADFGADTEYLQEIYGPETMVMEPCMTPLIVSGLSDMAYDKLSEFVAENLPYLELQQGPGGGNADGTPIHLGPVELEPGASVGGQLASGDIDLTAIGTLTWVGDDGSFAAFGHPFLGTGVANMPFVTSRVLYTMPSEAQSFKMGESIEIVGTITQDRLTAVAGYFGQAPEMVDINLKVIDRDIDRTRRFSTSVMQDEQWLPILAYITPMQGLSYATDRQGGGTCIVKWSVDVEEFDKPIARENLYWSSMSTSDGLFELYEILNILTAGNMFGEVTINSIDVEVECTSVRQTSDIIRARFQNAPNMGPGAIGYSGPVETQPDKADKNARLTEEALQSSPDSEEMQDIPIDESMAWETEAYYDSEYAADGMPEMVKYEPGDTIEVLVTLRQWRGEPFDQVIELEIPDDFPVGVTSIEIMGGMYAFYYGMYGGMADATGAYYTPTDYFMPPENIEEVVDEFLARDRNNAIVVAILSPYYEEDPYFYLQDDYEAPEQFASAVEVEDVIMGYFSLPVEIVSGDEVVDTSGDLDEMWGMNDESMMEEVEGMDEDEGGDDDSDDGSRNPHR